MWYLIIINVVTWVTYGLDKWKAKAGKMEDPGADPPAAGADRRIRRRAGRNDGIPAQNKKSKIFYRRAGDVRGALRDRGGGGTAVKFLNQPRIFMDGIADQLFYIFSDMSFCIFIQLIRIDRLSVFDHNMGLPDLRKMIFEDFRSVVHGDRNDGASALGGDLQGAVAERQHAQFFTGIAGPFGENADGDPFLT